MRTAAATSVRAARLLPGYLRSAGGIGPAAGNIAIALRRWPETAVYQMSTGRLPHYVNPSTYTEKVVWRKIFDRSEHLVTFCDKIAAKDFVRSRAPGVEIPEILWHGSDPEQVPLRDLDPPFVVKPNNRSGQLRFVWAPGDLDEEEVRVACRRWMQDPPHRTFLYEWAYSRVEARIMVERLIRRGDRPEPPADHKVFVFDGRAEYVFSRDSIRGEETIRDRDANTLPWYHFISWKRRVPAHAEGDPPARFGDIISAAERIASGVDHLRVDLYLVDDGVYFGETTVYPSSGHKPWVRWDDPAAPYPDADVDRMVGGRWALPPLARRVEAWRGLVGRTSGEGEAASRR